MDLIKMAAELFLKNMNANNGLDITQMIGAFQSLLPTQNGEVDLGALVTQFTQNGGDMMGLVQSFLGDSQNMNMSATQIMSIFGQDKIADFASQVNMPANDAASTLSNVIPELIDKNSKGGDLLGGIAGQLMGGLFR